MLMQEKVVPMSLLRCKPIGAIRMVEAGVNDVKIIAVCPDDPMFSHYDDVSQLSEHRFKEIRSFFEDYKRKHRGLDAEAEDEVRALGEGRVSAETSGLGQRAVRCRRAHADGVCVRRSRRCRQPRAASRRVWR